MIENHDLLVNALSFSIPETAIADIGETHILEGIPPFIPLHEEDSVHNYNYTKQSVTSAFFLVILHILTHSQ